MKIINRWQLAPLDIFYSLCGAAAGLAFLRLFLRLLAADELNPLGSLLVKAGGVMAAPFSLISNSVSGQTPGATFELAALLAGGGYILLALLVAAGVAFVRQYRRGGPGAPAD